VQQRTRAKGKIDTSWDELGWVVDTDGRRFSSFAFEDDDTGSAPTVINVYFPPGFVVDPHTHRTDYAEIVLDGSLTVGRRSYGPGEIRIVNAGTGYGPQIAGPDGCSLIFIYRNKDVWNVPLKPGAMRGLTFEVDHEASTVEWSPPA
jgi:hypothetical protein